MYQQNRGSTNNQKLQKLVLLVFYRNKFLKNERLQVTIGTFYTKKMRENKSCTLIKFPDSQKRSNCRVSPPIIDQIIIDMTLLLSLTHCRYYHFAEDQCFFNVTKLLIKAHFEEFFLPLLYKYALLKYKKKHYIH